MSENKNVHVIMMGVTPAGSAQQVLAFGLVAQRAAEATVAPIAELAKSVGISHIENVPAEHYAAPPIDIKVTFVEGLPDAVRDYARHMARGISPCMQVAGVRSLEFKYTEEEMAGMMSWWTMLADGDYKAFQDRSLANVPTPVVTDPGGDVELEAAPEAPPELPPPDAPDEEE